MGNVYSIDAERNLILYHSGKNIYLRSSTGEALTRAVSLAGDYAESLSDTIYQGTIFYAYQNTEQDIIIKNITDTNPYYKISSQDTPDCLQPQLTVFQNTLMLFYFVKNPVNEHYLLKCVFPDNTDKRLVFSEEFADTPVINLVSASKNLYLHLHSLESNYTLQLDESLSYCRLMPENTLTTQEASQYENRIQQLTDEHIKELQQQQLHFEKQLSSMNSQLKKELSEETEQLRSEIAKRNAIIDSAKRQYDELMNTAIKYRDEAIKWRNKFVGD